MSQKKPGNFSRWSAIQSQHAMAHLSKEIKPSFKIDTSSIKLRRVHHGPDVYSNTVLLWWHYMETLAFCEGNPMVTTSLLVRARNGEHWCFFSVHLNMLLNKQLKLLVIWDASIAKTRPSLLQLMTWHWPKSWLQGSMLMRIWLSTGQYPDYRARCWWQSDLALPNVLTTGLDVDENLT